MVKALEFAAMFPFLQPEGPEALSTYQITADDLLRSRNWQPARRRGYARAESPLYGDEMADLTSSGNEGALIEEIMSYLYARILVSAVNDPYLTKKYCLAEAKLFERRLKRLNTQLEGRRGATAEEIAPELRRILQYLDIFFADAPGGRIGLHFTAFLGFAGMIGDKNWALVQQDLRSGWVRLEPEKAFRVLEEAFRSRLMREIPLRISELHFPLIAADAERLAGAVKEARARFEGTGGVLDEASFPPCIKRLMEMTGKSENVPHMGRFTMVAFLHTIGYDKEGLISLFSRWPDFNISKSMYQIQHIIGEISGTEYTPPMCSTMKTYGICYNPDSLCATINHPLNYYRKKLRASGKMPPPEPKREKAEDQEGR